MNGTINYIVELLCSQSLKDLFNKENIEKAVNVVTGKNTASMVGAWTFTGAALEFESDNLLQKAGGSVAATAVEKKLDGFLEKAGITAGEMSFSFAADSTFQTTIRGKELKGTYSYDAPSRKVQLKFSRLLNIKTTVNCTSEQMELLFPSDKILDLMVLKQLLETLDAQERQLIYLRYFADKTQTDVGKMMGISQVQVSRMEKKILNNLRNLGT